MIQNKFLLAEEIYNKNSHVIGSEINLEDFLSMIFYHSHTIKQTVNGLRLTSYGCMLLSSIYELYSYNDDCNLTSQSIITMTNNLNGPWSYYNNRLIMFDRKDFAKLNLYGDFTRFIKSYNNRTN